MAVGIVCEFNPFHNGHALLLSQVRSLFGESVVCAMSGEFVQRGELAFYPKKTRAAWAVSHGADVVFENPFPFCAATAERFAASAIAVLGKSGLCESVAFGAEPTDGKVPCDKDFFRTAEMLLEKSTSDGIEKLVKKSKNLGYAEARSIYISEKYGKTCAALLSAPNSLLGVEYAKAILSQGFKLDIHVIPRVGAEHDGVPDEKADVCSASFLREHPAAENFYRYCPEDVARETESTSGRVVDTDKFYAALSARLVFADERELSDIAEMPHEYAANLKRAAYRCDSFEEFFESIKAKHITNAKLRRMLLFALTNVRADEFSQLPESAFLLAHSSDGTRMLRSLKKSEAEAPFTVLSKVSDMKKLPAAEKKRTEKQLHAERIVLRLCREK